MPSILGLDSRETAFVVWAVLIVGYVAVRSAGFRSSAQALLRITVGSILAIFIFAATAYLALTVWLLKVVGYWNSPLTKTTLVWFVGTGLVTAFSTKRKDERYFQRLVLRNVGLAAVITYVMNIHPFPLYVWIVLVPIVLLLAGCLALAQVDPQYAAAEKPCEYVLSGIGIAALTFSIVYVIRHFDELTTGQGGKEFLLPLVLTVSFIPFFYAVALVIVYETTLTMARIRMDDSLYRRIRREVIRACGLSLARVQLFEDRFRGRLWSGMEEAELKTLMDEFRQAWSAQRTSGHESRPDP